MDFAESNATTGINAAREPVQNSPAILLPLYDRVIDIIEKHFECANSMSSKTRRIDAA